MRFLTTIACAALTVAAAHAQPAPKFDERTLRVGALQRHYAAYVPAATAPGKPLLIVLHGRLGSGRAIRANAGAPFEQLADKEGFVIAYPDAMNRVWHDCRSPAVANSLTHTERVDDVGFLRALIKDAAAQYGVDPRKVYLYGFSNGGAMAMRMAWEAPQEVSAVAVIAMNMPTEPTCETNVKTPPIMFVAGTADTTVPYKGGAVSFGGLVQSAPETAAAFGKANGLGQPDPESDGPALSSDPGAVRLLAWRRDGRPVVALYTVRGGGHEVPRAAQGVFDTPSVAWKFFKGN